MNLTSSSTFSHAPQQFCNPKCITAKQLLTLFSRNQMNKQRLLKQLQQLDIDISPLQKLTLHQIYNQVEPIMKNTYSIKYLGLNKNQMGIISRRIDPTKEGQSILAQTPNLTYTINKYFYPKPLKVGKKPPRQEPINVQNLQTQIKKSFQNNNNQTHHSKNKNSSSNLFKNSTSSINNKTNSTNPNSPNLIQKKKQVHGSWLSIGKIKNTIYNEKRQKLRNIDANKINLSDKLQNKQNNVNSYAKFLAKGIILLKDC